MRLIRIGEVRLVGTCPSTTFGGPPPRTGEELARMIDRFG